MKKYGKTLEEVDAEKMIQCRNIVLEILNFGVTEFQKRQIIKLLACELEDVNIMKNIVNVIKEDSDSENFKKQSSELIIT